MAFRFAICEDGAGLETALGERTSSGDRESDGPLCYFSSCAALRQAMEAGARFDIVLLDLRQEDGAGLTRMLELFPDTSGTQVICVAAPDVCATVPPQRNVRFLDRPLCADALADALRQTLAELRGRQGEVLPAQAKRCTKAKKNLDLE